MKTLKYAGRFLMRSKSLISWDWRSAWPAALS